MAHLRDALYHSVNHPDIPTIYPPLAQLFFRTICLLSATPAAFKLALLLCDWGLCLLLAHSLVRRGQDSRRVVLYAWHPLPLVEVAGSGHIDALGVLLLFAALYALHSQRWAAAVCALAGAFLVKLVPLALLPSFWRRPRAAWFNFRQRSALLLFPALGLLAFWPFAAAGEKLATGLVTYVQHWHFNAAAYSLLRLALEPLPARWLCTALFALIALGVQFRYPDPLPSRLRNPRCLHLTLADCASLVPALGPPIPPPSFPVPLGYSSAARSSSLTRCRSAMAAKACGAKSRGFCGRNTRLFTYSSASRSATDASIAATISQRTCEGQVHQSENGEKDGGDDY